MTRKTRKTSSFGFGLDEASMTQIERRLRVAAQRVHLRWIRTAFAVSGCFALLLWLALR